MQFNIIKLFVIQVYLQSTSAQSFSRYEHQLTGNFFCIPVGQSATVPELDAAFKINYEPSPL